MLFIAMRYVQSTDLKALIGRDGRLTLERALPIVGQTASALDAAHRQGLVHRDVKPANILVPRVRGPAGATTCTWRTSASPSGPSSGRAHPDRPVRGNRRLRRPRADRGQGDRRQDRRVRAGLRAVRMPGGGQPVPQGRRDGRADRPPHGPGAVDPDDPAGAARGVRPGGAGGDGEAEGIPVPGLRVVRPGGVRGRRGRRDVDDPAGRGAGDRDVPAGPRGRGDPGGPAPAAGRRADVLRPRRRASRGRPRPRSRGCNQPPACVRRGAVAAGG